MRNAVTTEEIQSVCSYIGDDQTVANYFGVSRGRVERVRENMPRSIPRWMHRANTVETPSTTGGHNSHLIAADDAEAGSRRLNESIQSLFRDWEKRHGFKEGAAQILLPAGYTPEREVA